MLTGTWRHRDHEAPSRSGGLAQGRQRTGLGRPWSPPWAWLASLSPEGLACWGARGLRAPQRLQAGGACGSPQPQPRPCAGSVPLLLPFVLEFGKIPFPEVWGNKTQLSENRIGV